MFSLIFLVLVCCSKGEVPFGLSAGRRLLVDRFDVHANRVHKRGFTRPFPPKTCRHWETIDVFDRLRRQLVHVSRARVVHRNRQNHRQAFFSAPTSITSAAGADVCGSSRRRPATRSGGITVGGHFILGILHRHSCVLRVPEYRAYWKMLGDLGVCGLE